MHLTAARRQSRDQLLAERGLVQVADTCPKAYSSRASRADPLSSTPRTTLATTQWVCSARTAAMVPERPDDETGRALATSAEVAAPGVKICALRLERLAC
jgi:hypothetical protein